MLRIVVGVALLVIALFLLLSLLSHNIQGSAVLPDYDHRWPDMQPGNNWCGSVGAALAAVLQFLFGPPVSFLLVILLAGYGVSTLRSGKPAHLWLKLAAIVVLALSASTLMHLLIGRPLANARHADGRPYAVPRPAGWEGLLGYALGGWALPPLGFGAYLLFLTLSVLSFLVATEMLPYQLAAHWLTRWRERRRAKAFPLPTAEPTPAPPSKTQAKPAKTTATPAEPAGEPNEEEGTTTATGETAARTKESKRSDRRARERARRTLIAAGEEEIRFAGDYTLPPVELLDEVPPRSDSESEDQIREKAVILERTLAEFGIEAEVVEIDRGPVITQYEIELAPGIKITRVQSLADDIARHLKASGVRVIAPIPGKTTIGIEVPNAVRQVVRLRELIEAGVLERKRMSIPLLLGKDAVGAPLVADLAQMPHLLIAGATGAGKSVCINSIIVCLLMTQFPDNLKLILIDPKMVELAGYEGIPHLMCPVLTDMKKAAAVLDWVCVQMDARYDLLNRVGVRNITAYNKLGEKGIRERLQPEEDAQLDDIPFHMPYIVIIIDELADLMITSGKEVEAAIARISQKSRAVGIHVVMATQRPSVDVVTGLIKANLPCRIAFHTAQQVDSRTILDRPGAEKLLGQGDMLFLPPGTSRLVRAQGTFTSDEEIRRVVEHVKAQGQAEYHTDLVQHRPTALGTTNARDELYDEAVRIVVETQRGSVSLLQRKLGIGYSRAARLIDLMAENGILGPYKGSQAREVLLKPGEWPGTGDAPATTAGDDAASEHEDDDAG